jgi:hypothetical protein
MVWVSRENRRLAVEWLTNALVIKAIGIILIVSDKPVSGTLPHPNSIHRP